MQPASPDIGAFSPLGGSALRVAQISFPGVELGPRGQKMGDGRCPHPDTLGCDHSVTRKGPCCCGRDRNGGHMGPSMEGQEATDAPWKDAIRVEGPRGKKHSGSKHQKRRGSLRMGQVDL